MDKYAHKAPRPWDRKDRGCYRQDGRPKRGFSRRAAARAVAELNARQPDEPVHAYRCDTCGTWHIGHLPRKAATT